jgi:hypothetical protein
LWNLYNLLKEDLPITNNVTESWHNNFKSQLNAEKPNIWVFIKALQNERNINELKVNKALSGETLSKRKRQ